MTPENEISRDELALQYLDQLPYTPYPFQEEAIYTWFESQQGVLVCAPTGMGKTAVAEAGLFEALKTGKRAYYTTPLIALTEQKYVELQEAAERWGFDRSDVGLVTGNRRENIDAKILVVVAEILFNRLLASDVFAEFAQRSTPGAWRGFGAKDENGDETVESR
ncbi:MAG: DEAD/DEAH box helicase, partial [Thermoguttaceae bacterium]|nr:DEAD/DEAH box helicase [Thermoguttaceae bacterium]